MTTDFPERSPGPAPERGHCCTCEKCIDQAEAISLRDMLNVLNVKVADGYGAEVRREAGETRLERIGYVLERIAKASDENQPCGSPPCAVCQNETLWADLEDLDGRLQEIARGIPVCTTPGLCEKHGEDPDREHDRGR